MPFALALKWSSPSGLRCGLSVFTSCCCGCCMIGLDDLDATRVECEGTLKALIRTSRNRATITIARN